MQVFLSSILIMAVAAVPASERSTGETVFVNNIANWNKDNIHDGIGQGTDRYTMYYGNGETWAGWPARSSWVSFQEMYVSVPVSSYLLYPSANVK